MKNKFKVEIIAFLMAALSLTGCATTDDVGNVADLNGVWNNSTASEFFTLNDGNFTASIKDKAAFRGTCTGGSTRVSMSIMEWHGDVLNEQQSTIPLESRWYDKSQLTDALRVWAKKKNPAITNNDFTLILNDTGFNSMFRTLKGKINGNTMTINGSRYVNSAIAADGKTGKYMIVNSDSLNVRSGPSADNSLVGALTRGTRVQILDSSGTWWRIKSGSIEGYCNSSYLREET